MKNVLRNLAIRLNGEVIPARGRAVALPAQPPAPRSICRPSTGGLANPDWKFVPGSDLRTTYGGMTIGGKK